MIKCNQNRTLILFCFCFFLEKGQLRNLKLQNWESPLARHASDSEIRSKAAKVDLLARR